jgi:hypothetical protein
MLTPYGELPSHWKDKFVQKKILPPTTYEGIKSKIVAKLK